MEHRPQDEQLADHATPLESDGRGSRTAGHHPSGDCLLLAELAMQDGLRPALAAVHDGRCSGCGETLPDASRRLVAESLRVVPCSGCLRLLYDRGCTDRDFMPSTLRPVCGTRP